MGRLLKTTILFRLPDAAPGQTVVGQDDLAVDVDAVQSAVDRGGSVRLLGTFDFGNDARVLLQTDVAISGEADASNRPLTTITGGDWPFFAPPPVGMPPTHPGPVISIESIHFRHPSGGAIQLVYTSGAYIRANKLTAVRRRSFTAFFRHAGVLVGPRDAFITTTLCPPLVTGSIVVIDNEVHLTNPDPTLTAGIGVFVHPIDGADIYVARNLITPCARGCMDCSRLRAG
jgi:hypothetical protein